jgi:uncharacterized protein YndB with AHSA1/START domain
VLETQQNTLSQSQAIAVVPTRKKATVTLSMRVASDRRRVLHALSIPEYMEAWLQLPHPDEFLPVFDVVKRESFRIRLYHAKGLHGSIYGSSQVVDENRVAYLWRTAYRTRTTETLVNIRVAGGSRGCTVRLEHSGFRDKADSTWHSGLWHGSMAKLSRLIQTNAL